MSAKFRLLGADTNLEAGVEKHGDEPAGIVAYTHPHKHYAYEVNYLTNGQFGRNMAQNPTGETITSTLIHNGGDTAAWTASAVTGGGFDFTSAAQAFDGTQSIDASVSANNDVASFAAPAPLNPTGFSFYRMHMYITGWDAQGTKDVTLQWFSNGAPVGVAISIVQYVDTALFNTWQQVDIPMGDFQINSAEVDELQITTVDQGRGSPPDYYLDKLELISSSAGDGVYEYRWDTTYGVEYYLQGLRFSALTSGKTDLNSSEFFGLTALTNGIELVFRNDKTVYAALDARDVFDILSWGFVETHVEGSNNNVTIVAEFKIPDDHLRLYGKRGDRLVVRVRDDLSGMDKFTCSAVLARRADEGVY